MPPLLKREVLVFVSSSIVEFEKVRSELRSAVSAVDLVDSWIFEFHAVAAGETASEQYLRRARNCDMFLVLVGDRHSPATQDEYEAAFSDNPAKVLPLLVGRGARVNREFEDILRKRHTAPRVEVGEVVARAVEAIRWAVTSGTVVQSGLKDRLSQHIDRQLRVAAVEPRLCFTPQFTPSDESIGGLPIAALDRFALVGPSGAGKSYALSVWLFAKSATQLPIVLRARPGATEVKDLIAEAFDAVKFSPSPSLIETYAREGRLALALDGHDDLDGASRGSFVESLRAFADRFPRCSIGLAARTVPETVLPELLHAPIAPLPPPAVEAAFEAYGTVIRAPYDVPDQFRELAERPLWALLLAQYGTGAGSGADLLSRLVESRISRTFSGDAITQSAVTSALGSLAWNLRPSLGGDVDRVLAHLALWAESVGDMFEPRPAEATLAAAARTGLLVVEERQARFSHVLLATSLAASWLRGMQSLPVLPESDRELRALVAATLPEERMLEAVSLVASDAYSLAVALRMSAREPRSGELADDVQSYLTAAHLLNVSPGADDRPLVAHGDTWVAIADDGNPTAERLIDAAFGAWAAPRGDRDRRYTLWPANPFSNTSPLWIAGGQALRAFKEAVRAIEPPGNRFDRASSGRISRLISKPEALDAVVTNSVRKWAAVRNDLIARLPVATAGYPEPWLGEPSVSVRVGKKETRVEVSWGNPEPLFVLRHEEPDYSGLELGAVLAADPRPRIYHTLVGEIEALLGAPIFSEADADPSPLPALSWS